jgi:hypothetical protein
MQFVPANTSLCYPTGQLCHRLEPIQHLLGDLIGKLVHHLEDQTIQHLLTPLPARHQLLRHDICQSQALVRAREPSSQAILQNLLEDAVSLVHPVVRRDDNHSKDIPCPDRKRSSRAQGGVVEHEVVASSTIRAVVDCLTVASRVVAEVAGDVLAHCCWADDERDLVDEGEAFGGDGAGAAFVSPVEHHVLVQEMFEGTVAEVRGNTAAAVKFWSVEFKSTSRDS